MTKKRTEKEILKSAEKSLYIIEKSLSKHTIILDDINEIIPCYLHLNNAQNCALEYIDNKTQETFGITKDNVKDNGLKTLQQMCHPQDLEVNVGKITSFLKTADSGKVMSFFERLHRLGDRKNDYSLHFTTTKLYGKEQCIAITIPLNNLESNISYKVSHLLDENEFFKKNFERFATLTKREKEILSMLATGYNNPKIADVLFISRRTVENHRKNINKKLELKSFANLIKFAEVFDLV